jgi:uncharacterized membrane protein
VRSQRGLDRLVTFLDAVVAIAITLLVLPLADELGSGDQPLADRLDDLAAPMGAFLLSFVVIARLWLVHHRLVERVGAHDRAFVALDLLWLLTVVLLPFTTQVTAVYGTGRPAVGPYIGTMAASTLCLSALSVLVRRRPALHREGADTPFPAEALATSAPVLLALVLGVTLQPVDYFALLLLLFVTGPVASPVRRVLPAARAAGTLPAG